MPKTKITSVDDIVEWREKWKELINCMTETGLDREEIVALVEVWAATLVERKD
jgi:hypothetical protein